MAAPVDYWEQLIARLGFLRQAPMGGRVHRHMSANQFKEHLVRRQYLHVRGGLIRPLDDGAGRATADDNSNPLWLDLEKLVRELNYELVLRRAQSPHNRGLQPRLYYDPTNDASDIHLSGTYTY